MLHVTSPQPVFRDRTMKAKPTVAGKTAEGHRRSRAQCAEGERNNIVFVARLVQGERYDDVKNKIPG